MIIKNIKIANFESFKNLDIDLRNFNVLIGSNASGKSNFIQIFQFLRHIFTLGIENAISLQGGVEYFKNLQLGSTSRFSFSVTFIENFEKHIKELTPTQLLVIQSNEVTYELEVCFNKKPPLFEVSKEQNLLKCDFYELEKHASRIKDSSQLGKGEIILCRSNGKIHFHYKQIFVTTHNPDIVKYTELENILFISRDNIGFSTISRPIDKQEIHTFLQNEIGIEDIFIQNLLGT